MGEGIACPEAEVRRLRKRRPDYWTEPPCMQQASGQVKPLGQPPVCCVRSAQLHTTKLWQGSGRGGTHWLVASPPDGLPHPAMSAAAAAKDRPPTHAPKVARLGDAPLPSAPPLVCAPHRASEVDSMVCSRLGRRSPSGMPVRTLMGPPRTQGHGTREANQNDRLGGCLVSITASIDFQRAHAPRGAPAGVSGQPAGGVERNCVSGVETADGGASCLRERGAECRRHRGWA